MVLPPEESSAGFAASGDPAHRTAQPLPPSADLTDDPHGDTTFSLRHAKDRSAPSTLDPAAQFGDYDLLGEIARGSMGVVYKALDRRLHRVVALKMMLSGTLASPDQVQRFRTEAEAAAQLDHPGIVRVYEVGEINQQRFYAMAFVQGRSLHEQINDSPLTSHAAAEMLRLIAAAVEHAHNKGIVHRDLKPHNVLVDAQGHPHITDFGLAKRMDFEDGMTQSGDILGTPSFMSPEQARGSLSEIGPRSDVYALGAILYAMLTGRPPFRGATVPETLRLVNEQDPVAPRRHNPAIDRDLETICLKCLEKEPSRRYESAQQVEDELARYLRGEALCARPPGILGRMLRWYYRNPQAPIATAGGLTLFFALILIVWCLLGITFYATGLEPSAHPWRGMVESAALVLCVYLPMLYAGYRTLSGHRGWLFAATAITLALLATALSITFAQQWGIAKWEIMKATDTDLRARLQLGSLLCVLAGAGTAVQLLAIGSLYVHRGRT